MNPPSTDHARTASSTRLVDHFDWGSRTYVMGVLNVTVDSFSGDGVLTGDALDGKLTADGAGTEALVSRARQLVADGADLIDVGAESTRPGHTPLPVGLESQRLAWALDAIRAAGVDVPISVDTSRAEAARTALEHGADLINDITGLARDPGLLDVVVAYAAPIVLTHNCIDRSRTLLDGRLGGSYAGPHCSDVVAEVVQSLARLAERVEAAGLPRDQVILDPGIGLGKDTPQNLALSARLDEVCALGLPVLYGPSRKAFIGHVLDLPVDDRVEGTAAAVAVGITRGADLVRVHDVREMARVAKMTDAIARPRREAAA